MRQVCFFFFDPRRGGFQNRVCFGRKRFFGVIHVNPWTFLPILPNYSNFPQFMPKYSKLFQIIPKYSKIFQIIPNYSELFQIIPTGVRFLLLLEGFWEGTVPEVPACFFRSLQRSASHAQSMLPTRHPEHKPKAQIQDRQAWIYD